jgi:hypothetical protein
MNDKVVRTHEPLAAVRPFAQPAATVEATAADPGPGLPTTLEGVLKSIRDIGTDTAMATVMDRWKIGALMKHSRSLGIQGPAEIIASGTGLTIKQLHHCERINQVFELQALERFVRQGMRAQTITGLASEALDSAREFLLELFAAGRLSDSEVYAQVVVSRKASADDDASTHRTSRNGGLRFEIGIQAVPGEYRYVLAAPGKLDELAGWCADTRGGNL